MNTPFTPFVKRILRKPSLVAAFVFLLFATFVSNYAISNSGGKTGATQKNGAGCSCHCATSNAATGVTIATTATTFTAGETYTFTVTVTNAAQVEGGCNIAVDRGTLNAGTNLQKNGGELTHNAPVALPAVFTFTYTAPQTAGADVIYATGNAVNNDNGNGGGNCSDVWNDAANFNITVVAPVRSLSVTRSTIAFGKVRAGSSSRSDTLRLVSTGDAPITINSSAMNNATPFSSTPAGANRTITNGQSEVNTIAFDPTTRGNYTDTFVVNTNATVAGDVRKTVVVTGQVVKAIFTGAATMNFGNVKVGTTKDLSYTFQNTGDDTLFLNQPTLIGDGFTVLTPPSTLIYPPASSGSITIRMSPTEKKNYQASLTFTASNGVAGQVVTISGVGTQPQLSVAPSFDIGNVKIMTEGSNNLAVSNSGNEDLIVTNMAIESSQQGAKFSIQGSTSFTVQPTKSQSVTINYNPTVEQRDTATLTITSNDPTQPTKQIQIFGKGVVATMVVTPTDTINFGDVKVGGSGTNSQAIIQNQGEASLGSISVSSSASQFIVTNPPVQVSPGGSVALTIKFSPSTVGIVTGIIVVNSDDTKNPNDTIFVKGRGTTSQVEVVSSIDFGNIQVSKFKDTTIKIRNLGTAPVKIVKYAINDPKNVFVFTDTSQHNLAANDSLTFSLRFTANQELAYAGSLTITTDEASGGNRVISLSGNGINSKLTLDNASLDFGLIDTMKTSTKQITITNTGTASTTITNVTIEGSQRFTFSGATPPFTLAPSASKTLDVVFAPVVVQEETGTLRFIASEGSPLTASLHGFGKAVPVGSVHRTSEAGIVTVSLYPNPAQTVLNIQASAAKNVLAHVEIFDGNGKSVQTGLSWMLMSSASVQQMNIAGLPSGEYFVRIVSQSGSVIGETKFIVSH